MKTRIDNEVVAYCNHCGATGPWQGYVSSINHEGGHGTIVPTNCGSCHKPYWVSYKYKEGGHDTTRTD